MYLRSYNQHIVVVNTVEDAIAMFEKRSRVYSDRPSVTMVELATAAIVMVTMYDNEISDTEIQRFAAISEKAVDMLSNSFFPGAQAVNALPFLKYLPSWFPGAGFQTYAKNCKVLTDEMQNGPIRFVKEKMDAGLEVSGLAATLLRERDNVDAPLDREEDIKGVAATTFAAGADTTVSALETFMYTMVVHLEAQEKAQDELDIKAIDSETPYTDGNETKLDTVVGKNRLPNFSDRPSMPYVEAVYREAMRWYPVTPLGVAHATSEDDIYNGYIPKESLDYRAMCCNELRYPDPELFRPERFFDENGMLNDDDTVTGLPWSSYGKLNGAHFLDLTRVWLVIAATLATFNIRKAKDEHGKEVPVDDSYSNGLGLP
ncbi:hypothetical protein H0H92_006477 [Tricholoma furcatifolium]|nr:hypothetical protein H0H92_006477 [Tricholoma furcatifolium]